MHDSNDMGIALGIPSLAVVQATSTAGWIGLALAAIVSLPAILKLTDQVVQSCIALAWAVRGKARPDATTRHK